jgi:excisionase family DNA binding protein
MPSVKALDEAAQLVGVPRRTLQRWLGQGKLTANRIEGDRRRFVDVDEIKRLREPRPVTKTD